LCVVQPSNLNRYVEIRGRATIEADPDRTFIDSIAQRYMGVDHYPFDKPGDQRVTITVDIEAVACPDVPLSDNPPYQ
ncbi:MAG TPA: hypothetical protein PKV27_02405, partial [Ilumatobacteraceae bacterium]|nr:hypothetical protein [Ilumatobacteraceae bacterium]